MCDEDAIPPFREDSAKGTIDFLDRKAEDPERWNVFLKRLTYTCPVGYIIDRPDGDYSEQPDPIPEEQYSFEARSYKRHFEEYVSNHHRLSVLLTPDGLQDPSMEEPSCPAAFVS